MFGLFFIYFGRKVFNKKQLETNVALAAEDSFEVFKFVP